MSNPFTSLLELGFSTFALPHGEKEPRGSWKQYQNQHATSKQCQKWDDGKHNIAIVTGKISGIFVLDIDGEEGAATLRELEAEHGKLPHTVMAKTNRGTHHYFGLPKVGEVRNLASVSAHGEVMTGIDVRGEGGYVVAPPSLHPNGGRYEWINSPHDTPIADAPDWLQDKVVQPESSMQKGDVVCQLSESFMDEAIAKQCAIIEETLEGHRNTQLNKSAFVLGQLIHAGLPESRAIAALKCSALKIGLEGREIDSTIKSGITAGKKEPRVFNDRWDNPDMRVVHRPVVMLPNCPLHLLNEPVARFIEEAAACKCAPPDYILAALLCGVAGLIGNARQVNIWEDWNEVTSLWFMLVGLPSCNKSPALDAVFPIIREFEAKYQRKFKLEMQEYKRAVEQRKANKELLGAVIDEEPIKPMVKRVIVQDATVEKLALVLAENVKGLICLRDELAGLLANLEKHGGNDRPFYLESFGGRPTTVDRVKYQESIFVPSVLLSIIGSIQPDKLDELMLKQPDDGLASRFLYVSGVPRKIKEPDVKPDYVMLRNMLEAIEKLEVPLDEFGTPKPKQITLCAKGRSLIEGLGSRLQEHEQREYGMIISHLGKLRGIAARLALVLHYMDWALHQGDEPTEIHVRHVENAIAMAEHYFYPMGKHCLSNVCVPQDEQDAYMVARWILERQPTIINGREVLREVIPSRETKRRDAALAYLEESGWIRQRETYNKSVNYDVNPRVLKVL